ncbi:MAG: SLC13 family permease [Mycobacterium sp.]
MTGTAILAAGLLAAVLVFAVARPRGLPEAVLAVPAALLLVATGVISPERAIDEITELAPVVGFLAAVLVLAKLCNDEGLFHAAGVLMARTSHGNPRRLLVQVFGIAAATTAVLSLDATVVLLTPVVLTTARTMAAAARPHAYATVHLANSASLLLPVSNLTNLLAFAAAGVSFLHFFALMTAPWLVAVGVEYMLLRWLFAADLPRVTVVEQEPPPPEVPAVALVVVALTLVGFAATSFVGLSPGWAAVAGASVLACYGLASGRTTVPGMLGALNVPFLAFVLALGVVVRAVADAGLGTALGALVPSGAGVVALLGIAALAAVLSNVVNNLPAVLVLLPLVAGGGPVAVLAVLIGVNVGPNLTYAGSLANLLWRRVVHGHGGPTNAWEFTRVGLITVPVTLVLSVLALWAGARVIG